MLESQSKAHSEHMSMSVLHDGAIAVEGITASMCRMSPDERSQDASQQRSLRDVLHMQHSHGDIARASSLGP